jgi:hypothetical protein
MPLGTQLRTVEGTDRVAKVGLRFRRTFTLGVQPSMLR